MKIEELRSIALKLPAVTEDIKWENHLCFNIGGKMFLVTSPDEVPCSASFKIPEEDFDELTNREGFGPQAYMARYHWVHVDDLNRLPAKEWKHYIQQSYQLVASKLSKKLQKELGLL